MTTESALKIPLEFSKQLSPVDGKPFDLGIYKLSDTPMESGYRPATKRRYQFTGTSRGQVCNFPVEIRERHQNKPEYFHVSAIVDFNCWFQPDGWVHEKDLQPLD